MKISATSALVLNWTVQDIWQSEPAKKYLSNLDLSECDALLSLFSGEENYMHTQSVSNRKFFVRKCSMEFLRSNPRGQVVILAAGIAPMSIELSSFFPESKIFDVDKYLMDTKMNLCYGSARTENVRFIECDITDLARLEQSLNINGWEEKKPTLLVMEGITYYLAISDLENTIKFFASHGSDLVCDFLVKPELVDKNNRKFGTEVFRKIKETVGLEFVTSYTPEEFTGLLIKAGYRNIQRYKFNGIQKERTGSAKPFGKGEEPAWISMVKAGKC